MSAHQAALCGDRLMLIAFGLVLSVCSRKVEMSSGVQSLK
jgi:hypothetical protein